MTPTAKLLFVSFFLTIIACRLSAQQIGASTGVAIDLRNHGRYKQIPLSVQWLPGQRRNGSVILKVDVGIPLGNKSLDTAYTLQAGAPPVIRVKESISCAWFNFMYGYRREIGVGRRDSKIFIDLLPIGISFQRWRVKYGPYDQANYEIADPDVDLYKWGPFLAAGLGFQTNRLTAQAHLATPMLRGRGRYKSSYALGAPLQITFGYMYGYGNGKNKK